MWFKLVFVSSLAVGVLGRSAFNDVYSSYDPYEEYSQKIATEYCQATHAEDKVPEVKASIKTFAKCITDVIDTEALASDIAEATGAGAFDGVVKKYCAKSPQLKDCTRDLIKGVAPCLPPGTLSTSEKSTFAMIDFLCDKDGARIISFIKEDGVQCIKQNQMDIAFCQGQMQSNVTKVTNVYGGGVTGALLISEKERCDIVDNGLSCLVNALTGCSNKTPGRLAQELQYVYLASMSCNGETRTAEVAVRIENAAPQALAPSSETNHDIDTLMKRKLELEVRTAELEIWNRENELNVQHTILTSDIKNN